MSDTDYEVAPLSEAEKTFIGLTTEQKKPDLTTVNNGLTPAETDKIQTANKASNPSGLSFDLKAAIQTKHLQDTNFQTQMIGELRPAIDYWMAKHDMGEQQFADNLVWMEAYRGSISDEAAMQLTSEDRYKELKTSKIDPIENVPLSISNIGTQILGETLGVIGYQKEVVKQSLIGGVALGAGGAALGLAAGPAAPATVPALAAGGFMTGLTGTTFMMSAQLMSADMYGELRKKGIPADAAFNYALVGGTINGALETIELGVVGKVGKDAFMKVLNKSKPKIMELISTTAAAVGKEILQEELQEMTDIITETVAAIHFAKENHLSKFQKDFGQMVQDIPSGDLQKIAKSIDKAGSFGGVRERIVDTLVRSAYAAIGLTLGGKAVGSSAGAMTRSGVDMIKAARHVKSVANQKEKVNLVGKVTEESTPEEKKARAEHDAEIEELKDFLQGEVHEDVEQEQETEEQEKPDFESGELFYRTTQEKIADKKEEIKDIQQQMGQLDPEDKAGLKKLRGQLRKKVNQRKKLQFKAAVEEVERILDAAHSKFIIQKDETDLQRTKRFQGLIKKLVQKSDLEQDQKAAFISAILNTTTDKRLEKSDIVERIAAAIEEREKQKAVSDLRELLASTKPKQGQSKFEHKLGDVRQTVMDKLRHYVGSTFKENEQRVSDLYNMLAVADEETATRFALDVQIADLVSNLRDMDSKQTRQLFESIQDSIDIGTEGRLKEIEERQEFHDKNIKEFSRHLDGDKPVESRPWKPTTFSDFQKKMNSVGVSIFSFTGKVKDILFQHSKEGISKQLQKVLDVSDAIREADANRRKFAQKLRDKLENPTGKSALMKTDVLIKRLIDGAAKKEKVVYTEKLADGTFQDTMIEYTRNQLIQLYMQMQDKTLRRGLEEGNGFTFNDTEGLAEHHYSLEQALEEHLDYVDKSIARSLQEFYKEYSERVAREYKERTGLDLEYIENYSGFAYRYSQHNDLVNADVTVDSQANIPRSQFKTGVQGRTLARTNNALPLRPKDAFLNAMGAINETEHKLAWREKAENLNAIFTNPEIKEKIINKYGQGMYNSISSHLKDMILGKPKQQHAWLDIIEGIAGKASRVFLEWKPISFVKQLTSVINIALKIPVPDLVSGIFDYMANWKEANEVLKGSDFWQNRYANFDQLIYGALSKGDKEALKRMKASETGMMFLKGGDKMVSLAGGWAVYKYSRDKLGMSHEDALAAFAEAVNTTQSSGTMNELNDVSRGPLKVLTMFLQQPTRMFEYQMTAWREYVNGKNTLSNALRTTAITHLAQMAFVAVDAAWIWLISGDDDEKQNAIWRIFEQGLIGPQFALAGDILNTVTALGHNALAKNETVDKFMLDTFDRKPAMTRVIDKVETVPASVVGNTIDFVRHGQKLVEHATDPEGNRADVIQLLQVIADYGKSINVLVGQYPIEPPAKLLKKIFENPNLFSENDWLNEQRALHKGEGK